MILPFKAKIKDSDSLNRTFLYILIHCVKAAAHHIKKRGNVIIKSWPPIHFLFDRSHEVHS